MYIACMICKSVHVIHKFSNNFHRVAVLSLCSFVFLWRMPDAEVLSPRYHHRHQVRCVVCFRIIIIFHINHECDYDDDGDDDDDDDHDGLFFRF